METLEITSTNDCTPLLPKVNSKFSRLSPAPTPHQNKASRQSMKRKSADLWILSTDPKHVGSFCWHGLCRPSLQTSALHMWGPLKRNLTTSLCWNSIRETSIRYYTIMRYSCRNSFEVRTYANNYFQKLDLENPRISEKLQLKLIFVY